MREGLHDCLVMVGQADARSAPDARSPCGELSEERWNHADAHLLPLLRAARNATEMGELDFALFQGTDCNTMPQEQFAAAVYVTSRAPRWIDPSFIECAVGREADVESNGLWSLLDAASLSRDHVDLSFLATRAYEDERTRRRIGVFLGAGPDPARPTE